MTGGFRETVRAFLTPADQASVDEMRRMFSEIGAGGVGRFACGCNPGCLCARQCEVGVQQDNDAP